MTFWRDRPTFVTGATGLVGGWLVDRLLEAGADVVCLVRDWVPGASSSAVRAVDRVKVVRGDVRDQALLERTLGEYEIDTVFHLAAQTIVGIANRNPVSTFETNIRGTWALLEACRRSPLVKRIVLASSDKAYGDQEQLPYDEKTPLQGRHPYDVSKSCADLIATLRGDLRAAGRDHALRQLLRRRRPELEPHRPRHDPLDPARRAADHPLGRAVRPRLLLRRGRRRGLHAPRREAGGDPNCVARRSTSPTRSRSRCRAGAGSWLHAVGSGARHPQRGLNEIRTSS